jgi:putative effector of murein hydrolase LrgA (UPF0299 family)
MTPTQPNGLSPRRLAGALALLVFALCLVIGVMQAGNTFTTAVWRALVAMAGTFVIGLITGAMAQKVLNDNADSEAEKLKQNEVKSVMEDR